VTTPDTLPAPDRRRAATILLACMDDDGADTITATLDEAYAAPGGLQGLIASLAEKPAHWQAALARSTSMPRRRTWPAEAR
jgi:hypothetical protein